MTLASLDRAELRSALAEAGADGWLLFDFHGINPVVRRVVGHDGAMATRRLFVWIPATGDPVAVAHQIELQPLAGFPGRVIPYARWSELHSALAGLIAGRTVAMEISPDDAVPYLDRVPHGVVQLVTRLGATVVPSAPLVSRFAARWTATELADHLFAAEILAGVAREVLARTVKAAGRGLTETQVQRDVVEALETRGLKLTTPPIVGFGPNSANPHYEPQPGKDATLNEGDVVLLDLWGGRTLETVFADQTWMGFAGTRVPDQVERVWRAVRGARDAAIDLVQTRARAGQPMAAFEADRAARGVIEAAGYGACFVHRTGHSIDRDLHGSGPHLDDFETHDDRLLGPGLGFSVEPGVYLTGSFGVRSEVNVLWESRGARVTPERIQGELIVPH